MGLRLILTAILLSSTESGRRAGQSQFRAGPYNSRENYYFANVDPEESDPELVRACTTLPPSHRHRYQNSGHPMIPSHPVKSSRIRREAQWELPSRLAVYFPGSQSQGLKLRTGRISLPPDNFTVELWLKPEGGQYPTVTVLGLFDTCFPGKNPTWSFGIKSHYDQMKTSTRYFFTALSDRSQESTILESNMQYTHNKWTHLVGVYDGNGMQFYVDGVKVTTRHGQKGDLFSNSTLQCKRAYLSGHPKERENFRGFIYGVKLWNRPLTQSHIRTIFNNGILASSQHLPYLSPIIHGALNNDEIWSPVNMTLTTQYQVLDIDHNQDVKLKLDIPPCGQTLCDNPQVISSYAQNWQLRDLKTIRYKVINVANDDGTNPALSDEQLIFQNQVIQKAYKIYNISWDMEVVNINNTFLRSKIVLVGCSLSSIGDGVCSSECQHPLTGNDGGDCDEESRSCDLANLGNGICDNECNIQYFDWDAGDCCNATLENVTENCKDPWSPFRGFLTLDEYRSMVPSYNHEAVSVHIGEWTNPGLLGIATFPWENEAFSVEGGVVVKSNTFGREDSADTLVHELGHILGLWHVHHGVSEMDCDDPCLETKPSLVLGDLCSDTNPTVEHEQCGNPEDGGGKCGAAKSIRPTPFKNYMSYAGDSCVEEFSPQQAARMHCYLDLLLKPWLESSESRTPSPVPLPPKVIEAGADWVKIAWHDSLNHGLSSEHHPCELCQEDSSLTQYATSASSLPQDIGHDTIPLNSGHSMQKYWAPDQALGAPDAEPCKPGSLRAWNPDPLTCGSGPEGSLPECALTLNLTHHVLPKKLSLWIPWVDGGLLDRIEFHWSNGYIETQGPFPVQCDSPLTISFVNPSQHLHKVAVFSSTPFVSIDSLKIESQSRARQCKTCGPVSYKVHRDPAFQEGHEKILLTTSFIDNEVANGQHYSYTVLSSMNRKQAPHRSPLLTYTHGQAFCGDGIILNGTEQCDDGNTGNGDGCDEFCYVEKSFRCTGEPSICYQPQGDGICEDWERTTTPQDCGHFTPDWAIDQWPIEALTSSQSTECPVSAVLHKPTLQQLQQTCRYIMADQIDHTFAWKPCTNFMQYLFASPIHWIHVKYQKPVIAASVIIYFASAGGLSYDLDSPSLTLRLLGSKNTVENPQILKSTVSCHVNPTVIEISQSFSQPFVFTQGIKISFNTDNLAIITIGLRSHRDFDLYTMRSCGTQELYNSLSQTCEPYTCSPPVCEPLFVKYGTVNCSGWDQGDRCLISCQEGYLLESSPDPWHLEKGVPLCVNGEWVGVPACVPVHCGPPVVPHTVHFCPDGYSYPSRCKLDCVLPARKTEPGNLITECGPDGLWTFPDGFCQIQCPAAPMVKNATLLTQECAQGNHSIGDLCRVKCSRGYHVFGKSYRRRFLDLECNEKGRWVGPECVPVLCPRLAPVLTGLYSCTQGFEAGSSCTIKCPRPSTITSQLECLHTGNWNREPETCPLSNEPCPSLNSTDTLIFTCPNSPTPGRECSVSCPTPTLVPVLSSSPSQQTQQAETRHVVNTVICTGSHTWYPPVTQLTCLDRCEQEFLGDGYCDAVNNQAHCGWDQGDCCPSTVSGGVVRPFPAHCTSLCSCKDPQAQENLNRAGLHLRSMEGMGRLRGHHHSRSFRHKYWFNFV